MDVTWSLLTESLKVTQVVLIGFESMSGLFSSQCQVDILAQLGAHKQGQD